MSVRSRLGVSLVTAATLISPFSLGSEAATPVVDGREDGEAQPATTAKKPGYHTENFRVRPSLSVSETYDDNIFATDSSEQSDWITQISPQIRIDSTWDRHSLKFKAGADFGRYWEYDAENYLDYWANAEGRLNLDDGTDLFGGVGFSFEHEGRDSPDATLGGPSPTTYRSTNAHLGVKTVVGETTLRFGGTYENLDFDNVGAGSSLVFNNDRDRDLVGAGIRATHKLNAQNEVFIQALYDVRDYDMATDQYGYDRDSDGWRAALGLKSDLGGGNSVEAYLGTLHQSYEDDRFDSVDKADFGGRLTLTPGPDTKVTARVERSLNETTLFASPGYLSTAVSGRVEHRVSPRLIPQFSVYYELADYLQSDREDDFYSAEASLKYFLARNAYIVGGVRHSVRDSNDADLLSGSDDYTKNSIFLTFATQGYPLFEPMVSSFKTDGDFSLGLLSVSDDAVRFGRYSGLDEEGLYWNADVTMHSSDGERGYADIQGIDLGLDSRWLSIEWGSQGRYDAFVRYNQTPYRDFIGRTMFDGVGGTDLTRPAGWVEGDETGDMSTLAENLSKVEIGTMRKRLDAGTLLRSNDDDWTVSLAYRTDTKDGLMQMAGVSGIAPGNARSALLPVPVDYTTNTLTAALGYQADRSQLNFSYEGSFFYNNLEAANWESPFSDIGPRGLDGRTSLPPDNQFHQLMVSGGHSLTATTRLTGVASVGMMLQNEDFLADHVDPNKPPHALPRDSLDGEVYLYNAMLALTSRPLRGLNLKASYRMQKRDNQTDQDLFTYWVNDTTSGTAVSEYNQPYSYDRRTMQLDAGYRFNRYARLSGEIGRETVERSPSEVKKTTEDRGELKLRLSPLDTVQVSLKGGTSSRTGSDYQPEPGENPLLRKYNISDRDRDSYGIDVSYQPNARFALSASYDVNDDDYDATQVGLTDAREEVAMLDASYWITEELSTHAYLGRQIYKSHQAGSQVPNAADWWVQNEDTVDSFGAGLRWQRDDGLELGADYTLSDATGETGMQSDNGLPPLSQFPDVKSRLQSIRLYADYPVRKNTRIKLSYQYEQYDADDWSIDGVKVDSIPEVLLLGEDNPSYNQHVFGLAVAVKF